MKFEIEIPEWASNRNIYVFAGTNVLYRFYKMREKDEFIGYRREKVIIPCQRCGTCCGDCEFLKWEPGDAKIAKCGFKFPPDNGLDIPFSCAKAIGEGTRPECKVKIETSEIRSQNGIMG